mgnify:FL=1
MFGWKTLEALKPMLLMPFFECGESRTLEKVDQQTQCFR